ncbi:MAG: FHA domain-containing protein [Bradymonadia bacterium]
MPFAVVIHEKGGQPRRQDFDKNEVTIGRVQGNDIVLPKQNVSKKHSRIVVKDGKFIIVDLKSTNGTYVNGRKIASPMVIKESDKIYIGDFILSTEGTSAAAAPAPEVKSEPEIPKIEPPRKAQAAPAAAKVVPAPPAPIPPAGKAVAPSGAATAVSYGTPPASPPARQPQVESAPPTATPPAIAPAVHVTNDPFRQILTHAEQNALELPRLWTMKSQVNDNLSSTLKEYTISSFGTDENLAERLVTEVIGAGPLTPYIADDSVRTIYVDGPDRIQLEGGDTTQTLDHGFTSVDAVQVVAERLMAGCGRSGRLGPSAHKTGGGLSVSFTMHGGTPHLVIEKVSATANDLVELVKNDVLTDKMSEFLATALALNRTVVLSSSQLEIAQRLAEALVNASWDGERVVVIDPTCQMTVLNDKPHLNESSDLKTLCHHAAMLKANHLVFNGVFGIELDTVLRVSRQINGGAILIVKSYHADLSFDMLAGGLALKMSVTPEQAATFLKQHVDVIAHIDIDSAHKESLKEVIDTDGKQATLFSSTGDSGSPEAPAWFTQAAREGYEVDLELFQ